MLLFQAFGLYFLLYLCYRFLFNRAFNFVPYLLLQYILPAECNTALTGIDKWNCSNSYRATETLPYNISELRFEHHGSVLMSRVRRFIVNFNHHV